MNDRPVRFRPDPSKRGTPERSPADFGPARPFAKHQRPRDWTSVDSGRVIGQPIGRSTLRRDGFPHSTSGVRLGRRTRHRQRDLRRGGAGLIGQLLTTVLMSLGFAGAVLLVFLEVGLSEDRERAREDRQRGGADSHRPARARTAAVACLDGSTAASSELKRPPGGCERLRIQPRPRRRDRRSMVRGQCRCIPKT